MKSVYVAGPIAGGDQYLNVRNAVHAAARLWEAGYVPYVPHLSFIWHMLVPTPYEDWMSMDFYWIKKCDFLVRLPGKSPGSDREVEFARQSGIPVFFGLDGFLESLK